MATFKFLIADLATAMGAEILSGASDQGQYTLNTDTRTLASGQIFIPLIGERFDGHDFLARASQIPGTGVVVARNRLHLVDRQAFEDRPLLVVDDTTQALGRAGNYARGTFNGPMVAITGSSGKTTTRAMVEAILKAAYGSTLSPKGNFNNHIGVPLTLLNFNADHRAAVVELGMSGPGEIHYLAELSAPQVRVITNVGRAHLDILGDESGVAKAKGELFDTARPGDFLIVNLDDPWVRSMPHPRGIRVLTFGRDPKANIRLLEPEQAPDAPFMVEVKGQSLRVRLGLPGLHNRMNAAAAMAVAESLEIDLNLAAEALSNVRFEGMRMQVVDLGHGAKAVNDAYNANPQSMWAALHTAKAMVGTGGRLIAALGDMLELGPLAEDSHRQLGADAAKLGTDHLCVVGEFGSDVAAGARAGGLTEDRIHPCDDLTQMGAIIEKMALGPGDLLLVKGSRGMRMERLISILNHPGGG